MRYTAFVSVLMLGTVFGTLSGVASAQNNYVPARTYNNPGVVVNMDVLQQPSAASHHAAPPLRLRPPPPRAAAMTPVAPPPLPPATHIAPQAVVPPQPVASPYHEEAVTMVPYSTRALVESVPPVTDIPVAEAPVKAEAPKDESHQEATVTWDEPPVAPLPIETKPVVQKPVAQKAVKQAAPVAPLPIAPSIAEPVVAAGKVEKEADKGEKQARQLLAQAREGASETSSEARKRVLFDDDVAMDSPLPPPVEGLNNPAAALPAPLSIAPLASTSSASQKTAMLQPAPLPDTASVAIPTSDVAKNAETIIDDFEAYRLIFKGASSSLQATEREILDTITAKLKDNQNIRVQLRAYANGTPDSVAQARRLSLSRALAVRSYLVEQGIPASRLDVRALGNGSAVMGDQVAHANAPADRVDMVLVQ